MIGRVWWHLILSLYIGIFAIFLLENIAKENAEKYRLLPLIVFAIVYNFYFLITGLNRIRHHTNFDSCSRFALSPHTCNKWRKTRPKWCANAVINRENTQDKFTQLKIRPSVQITRWKSSIKHFANPTGKANTINLLCFKKQYEFTKYWGRRGRKHFTNPMFNWQHAQ